MSGTPSTKHGFEVRTFHLVGATQPPRLFFVPLFFCLKELDKVRPPPLQTQVSIDQISYIFPCVMTPEAMCCTDNQLPNLVHVMSMLVQNISIHCVTVKGFYFWSVILQLPGISGMYSRSRTRHIHSTWKIGFHRLNLIRSSLRPGPRGYMNLVATTIDR